VSENRIFIIERLRDYSARVEGLVEMLERSDTRALRTMFDHARVARAELSAKPGTDPRELYAVSLPVPDEPGVLSRITTAIGALGTNIEDIAIAHPLEGETGLLTLRVLGRQSAAEACDLLESMGYSVSLGEA
jgi:prephenate dehydrogenase